MKYYFAYGANTNIESMGCRCPNAEALGKAILKGHELVFRGVADVVENSKEEVYGALWAITPECEKSLDRFEGFPRLYIKKEVEVICQKRRVRAFVYVMKDRDYVQEPSSGYFSTIMQGYLDFLWSKKHIGILFKKAYGKEIAWKER